MGDTRVHAATLKRFVERDGAFLFAADRTDPSGPLVYLDDGTARARRTYVKEHLACPIVGCDSPTLTTVDRSATGRRDGYRHVRLPKGGAHAGEGFFHLQAKAALLRWAAAHPAIAHAAAEVHMGERIADVLLTGHHGHRIAVEVQYAGLDVHAWRARTDSYTALGITSVWLWGHTGPHAPSLRTIHPRLTAIQRLLVAEQRPVLWINPSTEEIAWAAGPEGLLPRPEDDRAEVHVQPLDDALVVKTSGIYPPLWLARSAEKAAARARRDARTRRALAESRRRAERRRSEPAPDHWRPGSSARPFTPGGKCDVCGLPVRENQERHGGRHAVCAYLLD